MILRRRLLVWALVLIVPTMLVWLWTPGSTAPLPPRQTHGAWLTHAWWGDDAWFDGSERRTDDYRGAGRIAAMAARLHGLAITDWYVHACPSTPAGALPSIDLGQARLLVAANPHGQVLAWVGGVLDEHAFPEDPLWRARFAAGCAALVRDSGIAGVQLNIEPCPSMAPGYLDLLDDLRRALPRGARLSIASYPPPTWLHPHAAVHWDETFHREISRRVDDLVVMAYDTSQRWQKPYTWLVARWTRQVMAWSSVPIRIGVPAYDDAYSGYHDPLVEHARSALAGVSAGLDGTDPPRWAGVAMYAEWTLAEVDEQAWRYYVAP